MRNGLLESLIKRVLQRPNDWSPMSLEQLEEKYPLRNLPEGAMVTRFAPSPTGFMHLGGLYQMLINYKLAKQSNGVFMLRIEDTDTKREVGGAVELIWDTALKFGLEPDEGASVITKNVNTALSEMGNYGPYQQSHRRDIYHSVVADLLARGLAYPCFLSSADMDKIRTEQSGLKLPTGIYGDFARDRNLTENEIITHLDAGEIPTIRLYSMGDPTQKIFCRDGARGSIAFPQDNEDTVLVKSNDGLPTYHFAHLIDDHFMRTTHVVRGEEWLPSLPRHIQMFNMMGWTPPVYVHTSTLDKIDADTGKQRKLSKRHDAEASVANFLEQGYPTDAVLEYLLNIASSGFEEEKLKNSDVNLWNYPIKIKKIPMSGALFDMKKLEWWAREYIGKMEIDDLVKSVIDWVNKYGSKEITNIDYLKSILSIERDDPKRVRKDFITWKQTMEEISYFWDEIFVPNAEFEFNKSALDAFVREFDANDDKDTWWNKIVQIAKDLDIKNGDVAMNLRVAITGRTNTPDLYSVMKVMGESRVRERIQNIIKG